LSFYGQVIVLLTSHFSIIVCLPPTKAACSRLWGN